MRLAIQLLAGAALCAALATLDTQPAAALDHQIGTVNIAVDHYTDVRWSRFAGPVDHITLMPENDAIDCTHITINYRNGESHDAFSGYLAAGQRTTISLPPPNDGSVRDVDFACRAKSLDGARVLLSAATDNWPRGWEHAGAAHVTTEAAGRHDRADAYDNNYADRSADSGEADNAQHADRAPYP